MRPNPISLFRTMVRMRAFDEACLEGVPTFEIHGELHTGIGQEAIATAMGHVLAPGDAVVSTHRNHFHALAKGVSPRSLLAEIFEKETGLCRGRGGHMHPFDPERNFSATGIVGASLPVALGYAYAFKLHRLPLIAVGVLGDGATNHGTFHECLNMASAWQLPLLCLVENNDYAISVRFRDVTGAKGIAPRAAAYDIWSRCCDGTDVEAITQSLAEAVAYTRKGAGPTLVEATCYRFRGHYEGDHDNYRAHSEKQRMRAEMDPISKYRRELIARCAVTSDELDRIGVSAKNEMTELLASVRADPMPDPAGAKDFVFAEVI